MGAARPQTPAPLAVEAFGGKQQRRFAPGKTRYLKRERPLFSLAKNGFIADCYNTNNTVFLVPKLQLGNASVFEAPASTSAPSGNASSPIKGGGSLRDSLRYKAGAL